MIYTIYGKYGCGEGCGWENEGDGGVFLKYEFKY